MSDSPRRTGSEVRSRGATSLATVAGLCSLVLALSLGASSAGAVVAKIRGHGYGVTPITGVNPASMAGAQHAQAPSASSPLGAPRNFDGAPKGGGPLLYEGGPVMHSDNTHVIYWDPNSEFTATTKGIVGSFFTNVAHDSGPASNVFAVAGQYTDSTGNAAYNSTFGGALIDTNAYPTSGCTVPKTGLSDPGPYTECLFDEQLQQQLTTFIDEQKLPVGPTQLYFLLLPHKVATCVEAEEEGEQVCSNNFFCAYHSYIAPGTASEIIYADIPFSLLDSGDAKGCQDDGNSGIQQPNPDNAGGKNTETRFADVALKYISHEYIEAATDPLLNAWFDANGLEIGDKCNGVTPDEEEDGIGYDKNAFLPTLGGSAGSDDLFNQSIGTGSYYLQSEWDNAAKACLMKPLALSAAEFTPTSASTTVGSTVNFKGSATDPYGQLDFAWTFGDGGTGTGSSPNHTYAAPGSYTVTMTPKDALTGSTATPVEHTVTVSKSPQTITFTSAAPGSATVGGSTYTVAATASSGLPVSFTIDAPSSSVCSISGATVSFVGPGTCTIDANQAGDADFGAAPQMQQSFAVGKGSQTITFTSATPGSATVGGTPYTVTATASSGLPVSFSSATPSVCSLSGSTVSFLAVGMCTIDANQAGNSNYDAAPQAQQSFALSKGSQTITFTSTAQSSATVGGPSYTVAATTSSGLPVSFSSATPSVCSLSGSTVSFLAAGTCTTDANQAGNGEYEPAPQVQQSFAVASEPLVTSFPISRLPSELTSGSGQIAVVMTTPNSNFSIGNTTVNPTTGVITFTASVSDPGAFAWLLTFQNGKFGVFASTAPAKAKCKAGFVRLKGKCRSAKVLYAKGEQTFAAAGTVKFTLEPSASAKKALENALNKHTGLSVSALLIFQSSSGGSPVSHTRPIIVKLSKTGKKGRR
jgi:PKD repeat protein